MAIATHAPGVARATISILPDDLLRSIYVVGKTGSGKSAFLERLLLGAVEEGFGACLIDPHGDLAQSVLGALPSREWHRVALLRPADTGNPVGLNLLTTTPGTSRALVASGLVEVFRKLWGPVLFGPRSEHLLRHAILALLETPGSTLLSLLRLLTDDGYRLRVVARVTDPVVRLFWLREFPALGKSFTAEVTSPVLNKLGALAAPAVRRLLGQAAPRLRLRDAMDAGRILVVDLSGIGRDAAELIGALVVTGLGITAHARSELVPEARRPFLIVADEFHTYTTGSFSTLLAEGRKFGLCAALAHQHAAQLDPAVRAAILGNVGTLVAFTQSADDAAVLARELVPDITADDLVRLARYQIALRLLRHGVPVRPVICKTLAPPIARPPPPTLLRISEERYGRSAAQVNREIADALGSGVGKRERRLLG